MLVSMTGFGRAEAAVAARGRAVVEIHTLNHKFLEMECRLPEGFQSLEEPIRAMAAREFRRGRVKISASLKTQAQRPWAAFQTSTARQYVTRLKALQRRLKIPGVVTLEMVMGLPEVITFPKRDAEPSVWWPALQDAVSQALAHATRMRRREGQRLSRVLARHVKILERLIGKIDNRLPVAQRDLTARLTARIQALGTAADAKTIAHEAGLLVQANDVSEELARLRSHFAALRQAVAGKVENPGRTLDFLAQELHREVNTLGVKVRDAAAIRWVIAMKGEIEKLREQAANVE